MKKILFAFVGLCLVASFSGPTIASAAEGNVISLKMGKVFLLLMPKALLADVCARTTYGDQVGTFTLEESKQFVVACYSPSTETIVLPIDVDAKTFAYSFYYELAHYFLNARTDEIPYGLSTPLGQDYAARGFASMMMGSAVSPEARALFIRAIKEKPLF